MDPEQTFIRVQERFSEMLTPRIRATLEYFHLFAAITLFCILVVMHANYVQQPGCSSELQEIEASNAQLIQIKISSALLWSQNVFESEVIDVHDKDIADENRDVDPAEDEGPNLLSVKLWLDWISSGSSRGKSPLNLWKNHEKVLDSQTDDSASTDSIIPLEEDVQKPKKDGSDSRFSISPKESLKAAIFHLGRKWYRRIYLVWRFTKRILGGLWDISGIHLNLDVPKWLKILHLDKLNSYAVQWLGKRSKLSEPTYLYTIEKGYLLLPDEAKLKHNILTINVSISAWHQCFGNRWQQLLINRLVGYDTILMNSLLNSAGHGYLYNYQTKEFYNLTYAQKQPENSATFGDCQVILKTIQKVSKWTLALQGIGSIRNYLVTKCGVLMMSLFVFFTTTMSVSFTLRETQTRMLKFTVQLQHHAQHRLPTFQLIFVHVIESLVFVPIMIGILFFLFEFYDDQLLAFMVLILVWLCELFTLISVRTPISMKFFPRFFLLYFLVFHIYFFSYAYGFSYLALSTTSAFMQHLILYFWNRFEVPALQRYVQTRRSRFQQHPGFHITSSTILASTLHITRLNTRNQAPVNTDLPSQPVVMAGLSPARPVNGATEFSVVEGQADTGQPDRLENTLQLGGQADLQQPEASGNPGSMNSFSSLLLWILGGASSEGLNSLLSIFRDIREHGQAFPGPPQQENNEVQNPE